MTMLIRQEVVDEVLKDRNTARVTTLIGPRYCGKSTILRQAYQQVLKEDHPEENVKYIDFTKKSYDRQKNSEYLAQLLDTLRQNREEEIYLFLDNIEYVKSWGRLLHYNTKYRYNLNIYIAPQNSSRITNKNLRKIGYKHIINIYPFSFREILEYNKQKPEKDAKSEEELYRQYKQTGGLPEIVCDKAIPNVEQIIRWSYDNTVIPNTYKLEYAEFAKTLIRYIIMDMGQLIYPQMLQKFINHYANGYFNVFNISQELLQYYLQIISNMEILETCPTIYVTEDKQRWNDYRFYTTDPSYKHMITFRDDTKDVLESIVFIELRRRKIPVSRAVIDGEEITFLHKNRDQYTYIQVENTIKDENKRKKVYRKLRKTGNSAKYIISEDTQNYTHEDIQHVNIIDFLKNKQIITEQGENRKWI
ncbi:MAG: hypothetical protein BZ136_03795 [Methanosphaera sp. rholeuAM74]|nr:MAG: hypothetical protein BZ136_03795 [Methanosphaera sp. rholeuAM74]